MGVFQLCALAVGGMFIVVLLRQYHPVFAIAVSLVLTVGLLLAALQLLTGLQQTLSGLFIWARQGEYAVVLRVIGIGLLVQATAELAREAGQPAMEGKVILLGKLLMLGAALPLIGQALQLLSGLLI